MLGGKNKRRSINEELEIIKKILDVSEIDTAYRDIYIDRAKQLLTSGKLPIEEYHEIIRERERLSRLPGKINASMERGDWQSVKELSKQMIDLHKWVEQKQGIFEIGRAVFDDFSIHVNPFYPGLYHVAGIKLDELPIIRKKIVNQLVEINSSDILMNDFYTSRKEYFDSLNLYKADETIFYSDKKELSEQAKTALEQGNIELVEKLSERIIEKHNSIPGDHCEDKDTLKKKWDMSNLNRNFEFSSETLSKAEKLQLAYKHIDESPKYTSLQKGTLHPEFGNDKKLAWEKIEEADVYFNKKIPETLKTHTEIFTRHILINSCGTRYLPDFINEDILVEDFSETDDKIDDYDSPLLRLLGLKKRRSLSRLKIEQALSLHSHRIIKDELALDPLLFKLVCIPSDIYLRLGETLGWGQQQLWTHFDGYEILQNGKFNALVGGDTSFGGIYDIVNIGREYESAKVMVRFAVVMRERMLRMV